MRDNLSKIRSLLQKIEKIHADVETLDSTDRMYLRSKILDLLQDEEKDETAKPTLASA